MHERPRRLMLRAAHPGTIRSRRSLRPPTVRSSACLRATSSRTIDSRYRRRHSLGSNVAATGTRLPDAFAAVARVARGRRRRRAGSPRQCARGTPNEETENRPLNGVQHDRSIATLPPTLRAGAGPGAEDRPRRLHDDLSNDVRTGPDRTSATAAHPKLPIRPETTAAMPPPPIDTAHSTFDRVRRFNGPPRR